MRKIFILSVSLLALFNEGYHKTADEQRWKRSSNRIDKN